MESGTILETGTRPDSLFRPLVIGEVTVPGNIFLAPMAGWTDLPMRRIAREFGCPLTVSEMVSVNALAHGHRKTFEMLRSADEEKPFSIQLFGKDPEFFKRAVEILSEKRKEYPFDIIDINMGCPAPKINRDGAGATLLRDMDRAHRILSAVVRISPVPVTLKTRTGYGRNEKCFLELITIAEEAGIKAVTVHARTRDEKFSGKANWSDIALAVQVSKKIPVIGNGDVRTPEDAEKMMRETGCAGVAIGRGAIGKPWIFSEISEYFNTGRIRGLSYGQIAEVILRHARYSVEVYGQERGIILMRKQLLAYTHGWPGVKPFREKLKYVRTIPEIDRVLKEYEQARGIARV